MISLNANIDTNIAEFLAEYDYYLFIFSDGCKEYKYILQAEEQSNCGNYRLFTINVDIPMGGYKLEIFGQSSSTNEDPNEAELLHTEQAKIYNPEAECFGMPFILDEFGYPLLDENGINILQ